MATTIQGYDFEGDPDGLKFVQGLAWDELMSLVYLVDNKGKANFQSNQSYQLVHFEIVKSSGGVYVISKI